LKDSEYVENTPPNPDPEVELMLAFCRGNEDAFVQLYKRYRDRIINHARRLLNDQAQAEEASQEVFLRLYQTRGNYQPLSRFSTFVFRIATNYCLNICARSEHKLQADTPLDGRTVADCSPDQEKLVAQEQLRNTLSNALATLPDKQRAALVLCHYEGLSYLEAAEALEVSESALKSLVHRARQAMIATLGPVVADTPEVTYAL
jgi:RNA polymerase sigma-70 factor (ECF subfamily)